MFFFEKKNQKTFLLLAGVGPREAEQKSFFGYFFFKKSNFFLWGNNHEAVC